MSTTAKTPVNRLSSNLVMVVITVAATLILVVTSLQLWKGDLRVPFSYDSDALSNEMLVKGVIENGWYQKNPSLGAPFGQVLYDYPLGADNLNFGLIKLLGVISDNALAVTNLFFISTFVLISLTALLVLRRLGVSWAISILFALLYSFSPYHLTRGEVHLFLSSYFSLPLTVLLCIWAASDEQPFSSRIKGKEILAILSCLVIGSSGIYYAAFSMMLLLSATAIVQISRRRIRRVLPGIALAALILVTVLVNLLPTITFQLAHGANESIERGVGESEINSLKIAELILPIPEHRLESLSDLRNEYAFAAPKPATEPHAIGGIASIGFLVALVIGLRRMSLLRNGGDGRLSLLALMTFISVLIGTTGGFSVLFSLLISPQLRAWNRIAPLIGFLALGTLAICLERARPQADSPAWKRVAFASFLSLIGIVGMLDQTSKGLLPDYGAIRRLYDSDRTFVRQIEAAHPGAMVYQLPHHNYPEGGIRERLHQYDMGRPYLHSTTLAYSFGTMKNRSESDWLAEQASKPADQMLPVLSAVGFDGVMISRLGYSDRNLEQGLDAILEGEAIQSPDGEWVFFDMGPFNRELQARLGKATLEKMRAEAFRDARES